MHLPSSYPGLSHSAQPCQHSTQETVHSNTVTVTVLTELDEHTQLNVPVFHNSAPVAVATSRVTVSAPSPGAAARQPLTPSTQVVLDAGWSASAYIDATPATRRIAEKRLFQLMRNRLAAAMPAGCAPTTPQREPAPRQPPPSARSAKTPTERRAATRRVAHTPGPAQPAPRSTSCSLHTPALTAAPGDSHTRSRHAAAVV